MNNEKQIRTFETIGVLCLLLMVSTFSCTKVEETKSFWDEFYTTPYVISEKNKSILNYHDSLSKVRNTDLILPPVYLGTDSFGRDYMPLNLLIHQNKHYYYTLDFFPDCVVGDKTIFFQDLTPEKLVELPANMVHKTLIDYYNRRNFRNGIAIASSSDTITSKFLTTLTDSLERFLVRRITEEEHHVLDAKTRNIPYNPKNYKWVMNYYNKPL